MDRDERIKAWRKWKETTDKDDLIMSMLFDEYYWCWVPFIYKEGYVGFQHVKSNGWQKNIGNYLINYIYEDDIVPGAVMYTDPGD